MPYWSDFDCTAETRRIAHPATVHVHCKTEREACLAFIDLFGQWLDGRDGSGTYEKWPARYDVDTRYACVRGPDGLVRGVIV